MEIKLFAVYTWCKDTFLLLLSPLPFSHFSIWGVIYNLLFWLVFFYSMFVLLRILYDRMKKSLELHAHRVQSEDLQSTRSQSAAPSSPATPVAPTRFEPYVKYHGEDDEMEPLTSPTINIVMNPLDCQQI